MDACKACAQRFDDSERSVLCSGPCGKLFHQNCAGLNVTNFKAWMANVGLLWFCDACRLNFNPVITERETLIISTMRDMLTRMDSIDLRIGQYGENLKVLNSLLTIDPVTGRGPSLSARIRQRLSAGTPLQAKQVDFCSSIDQMNFDTSLLSNPANNTLLDESNTELANVNELTTAAAETAGITVTSAPSFAAIVTADPAPAVETVVPICTGATIAVPTANIVTSRTSNYATVTADTATTIPRRTAASKSTTMPPTVSRTNDPNVCRLRVVHKGRNLREPRTSSDETLKSFYITPFHNEQTEDDIKQYLRETINADADTIKCARLVPKGKSVNELSFVSFKLSVPIALVGQVSDTFYWPEGVEVREFVPKNDQAPLNIRPPVITH